MSVNDSVWKALLAGAALAGAASPAWSQINVSSNISTSTTWTANNTYNLTQQIYVLPGATLTIQPGTVVASTPTVNGSGSLAVCRGAQIFVQGTQTSPVVMTSTNDTATWIGGDPHTGTWHLGANEWGNLTIMGEGYISENATAGNTAVPSASNVAAMEGLTAAFPGDPNVLYGGGDDDDDSGTITFLSLRYGGRVIGLANELNGLSLGGIGRGTDIHHVEIMNNVDDGIEIWGGTVNLKYISIWNIGDDSIDVDQGWRGKLDFGLIVQGYSLAAAQGSGVGDNGFEMDGAEQSDWQPVTTSTIYNCTFIGQPYGSAGGDHATAWRDNARVQFRNCIFMDVGDRVVSPDNVDGDGGLGYGFNGTLSWPATWTTPYTATSTVNPPANPGLFYTVQASGNLIELKDSVFYNNTSASAYTEANAQGVFAAGNNNVQEPALSPIASITREPAGIVFGSLVQARVTSLDPRPANSALTSVAWAPNDGFFSSAHYRGAFSPGSNWLFGWTASHAYGLTNTADEWTDLGSALAGTYGDPVLSGSGTLLAGAPTTLALSNAKESAGSFWVFGTSRIDAPIFGGILVPNFLTGGIVALATDPAGALAVNFNWPPGVPSGTSFYIQFWTVDPVAPQFVSASNAISLTTP